MEIIIINGPNLNLLGKREPGIYGKEGFDIFFEKIKTQKKGLNLTYFQSNSEGEIIDKLHEVGFNYDGIILNAGGYTHTSISIADAVKAVKAGRVEFKMDKTGALAVIVGKRSFANEQLAENAIAALDAVVSARPDGFKGKFIKSVYISSTMSPSVRINPSTLNIS